MLNDKRFFAFGCSYTNFHWPTWADIIGINFNFYMNYGKGGACNLYILRKFLEANEEYKFNENDVIVVMLTGYSRFTFIKNKIIQTNGCFTTWVQQARDITSKSILVSGMWTEDLGVTNSYLAARSIKNILDNVNCEYKILSGLNNSHFIKDTPDFYEMPESLKLAKRIHSILDVKLSMDEWITVKKYQVEDRYVFTGGNVGVNMHPTIDMHAEYVKEYFPQYYTDLSAEFVESEKKQLNLTDTNIQASEYSSRKNKIFNHKQWNL